MTITLPDALTEPLSWIGLEWPEADEDQLQADGQAWIDHGTRLRAHASQSTATAQQVWMSNEGATVEAFERWWNAEDGPNRHLDDAATAAELIGAALIAMAGVTIALKTAFIAQLTALAFQVGQAVVTAFATAGAAAAQIPVWIALTRVACRKLIQQAMAMVEGQIAALLRKAAALLKRAGRKNLADRVTARSQGVALKGLLRQVELTDVSSPVNGANFYSGEVVDGGVKTKMREYAEANTDGVTSVTLEQTPGGTKFDTMYLYEDGSPITPQQADVVWHRLSERYAQGAEGEVTAWVHNPRATSIWLTSEKQALENNPAVTAINEIDPVKP